MKELIYIICMIASVCLSIVISIISIIKDKRKKNSSERTEKSSTSNNKLSSEILKNIPKYMIAAEQLYNNIVNPTIKKTGAQKLAYVLDKVKIDCLTNNVEYDENIVTTKVEELVDLTKQVNSN